MQTLTLSFCLFGWLWLGSLGWAQDLSGSGVAARKLLHLVQRQGPLRFQLESEYDPYRRGQRMAPQQDNPQYLALAHDRRYLRYNRQERTRGIWQLDLAQGCIIFVATQAERQPEQRFLIRSFHDGQLVLIWQGRHGYVRRCYRLLLPPQAEHRG